MSPSNWLFPYPQFKTRDHQFDHRRSEFDILTDKVCFDLICRETQIRVQKRRCALFADTFGVDDSLMIVRGWGSLRDGAA